MLRLVFSLELDYIISGSITSIIDSLVGLLQNLAGHGVHAVSETVVHLEELRVKVAEPRHSSRMLDHLWVVILETARCF